MGWDAKLHHPTFGRDVVMESVKYFSININQHRGSWMEMVPLFLNGLPINSKNNNRALKMLKSLKLVYLLN